MRRADGDQSGATLITVLVMLLLVLMLGLAAAQIALLGEKAARNDRDRQIALQAAEAALLDAELDIQHSPDPARSRSHIFSRHSELGFPLMDEQACASGESNPYLGLCRTPGDDGKAIWSSINFLDNSAYGIHTVNYGRFTGNSFFTGVAALPARAPRYVIELLADRRLTELSGKPAYFYRITAIGYGASGSTQVVLQSVYRKRVPGEGTEEQPFIPTGRLSWREMINWTELNTARH